MAATQSRLTPRRDGASVGDPVAAGARIFAGCLYVLDSDGNAVPAGNTVSSQAVVRAIATEDADNRDGAAGAVRVSGLRVGCFAFASHGAAITRADIGKQVTVHDDQTITKDSNSKHVAGTVIDVDAAGVWVQING